MKTSQTLNLLHHLFHARKSITPAEARQVYRVERLAARVLDLKACGLVIRAETVTDVVGKRYTRYAGDTECSSCQRIADRLARARAGVSLLDYVPAVR